MKYLHTCVPSLVHSHSWIPSCVRVLDILGTVEKFCFVSSSLDTEHLIVLVHDIFDRGFVRVLVDPATWVTWTDSSPPTLYPCDNSSLWGHTKTWDFEHLCSFFVFNSTVFLMSKGSDRKASNFTLTCHSRGLSPISSTGLCGQVYFPDRKHCVRL